MVAEAVAVGAMEAMASSHRLPDAVFDGVWPRTVCALLVRAPRDIEGRCQWMERSVVERDGVVDWNGGVQTGSALDVV